MHISCKPTPSFGVGPDLPAHGTGKYSIGQAPRMQHTPILLLLLFLGPCAQGAFQDERGGLNETQSRKGTTL